MSSNAAVLSPVLGARKKLARLHDPATEAPFYLPGEVLNRSVCPLEPGAISVHSLKLARNCVLVKPLDSLSELLPLEFS